MFVARVTTKHVVDLVDRVKDELVCIAGDGEPRLCTLPHPTNTLQDTGPGNKRREEKNGGEMREARGGRRGGKREERREEGGEGWRRGGKSRKMEEGGRVI